MTRTNDGSYFNDTAYEGNAVGIEGGSEAEGHEVTVNNNNFIDTPKGVENKDDDSSNVVGAENNYWDHPSGHNSSLNNGSGARIVNVNDGSVDGCPYLNDTYPEGESSSCDSYYTLQNLAPDLDVVNPEKETENYETYGQIGIRRGIMKSNGVDVANLSINFSKDWDWSDIKANMSGKKSLLDIPAGHEEIIDKKLKVPVHEGTGKVYVCPGATSLNDVNPDCPDKYKERGLVNKSGYYQIDVSSTGATELGESNLRIWDEDDEGNEELEYYYGETVNFYANYTANGSSITNSYCNITLWDDSTYEMTRESSDSPIFNYSTQAPGSKDEYYWDVDCWNDDGYEDLSTTDSIIVGGEAEEVIPEFNWFGMILIIAIAGIGMYFITSRKNK